MSGRRRPHALQRALIALWAFVLVFGALQAGSRYAYCATMGELRHAPCCPSEVQGEHADEGAALQATTPDCCRALTLGALPEGTAGASPVIAAASFVALAAPPWRAVGPESALHAARRAWAVPKATAPPHDSAARSRARLSVFLL